jgi:hypothetical protein
VNPKPNDLVDFQGTAFTVTGLVDFAMAGRHLRMARLAAGPDTAFVELPAHPGDPRVLLVREIPALDLTVPPPAAIYHAGESYLLQLSGPAAVTITGMVPARAPGACTLWRYRAAGDRYLQIEAWPDGVRMLAGATVHQSMIEVRATTHP